MKWSENLDFMNVLSNQTSFIGMYHHYGFIDDNQMRYIKIFVSNINSKRIKQLSNLDKVLEVAMTLPLEQQEMLVQILKKRIIESRRDEIASDAAASITEFQAGTLKVQTAAEAIQELREYLNHPSASDV